MANIIQLRNDTAANWSSVNPILMAGEMGIERDTNKQKIGDSTTTWNSLTYVSNGGSGSSGGTTLTTGSTYQITSSRAVSASYAVGGGWTNYPHISDIANEVLISTNKITLQQTANDLSAIVINSADTSITVDNSNGNFIVNANTILNQGVNVSTNNMGFTNGAVLNAPQITGSLYGSASYAGYSLSASYAPGNPSISASYAVTASYALNGGGGGTTLTTGSTYPVTSSWTNNLRLFDSGLGRYVTISSNNGLLSVN